MTLSSTITKISAVAISGAILSSAAIAQAISINRSSGFWTETTGGQHIIYGNGDEGSTTFGDATVQGETGKNQVRWGTPFPESGLGDPNDHENKSGLGFVGVGAMDVEVDEVFELGTLLHYNNPVKGSEAATAAALDVKLDLGDELGIKTFSFNFEIEETLNSGNVEDCTYESETPCADRISWSNDFASQTFTFGDQEYTVELLGFRESIESPLVEEFISQENGTSSANLYARLTVAPPSADVPEPASLLGLGLVGGSVLVARRRRR